MSIVESYALSPLQQGMLFSHLMAPGDGADIEQLVVSMPEPVDAALLERAWRQVAERHPVLRTSFRWEGIDHPLQDVHDLAPSPFTEYDWRLEIENAKRARLAVFLEGDRRQGFDLASAPASRLALFRFGDEDYRLVWTFHHILMDGRSFRLVLVEAFELYESLRQGSAIPKLAEPRPYRDYIDWLGRLDSQPSKPYWRETLRGFSSPTALPLDKRPATDVSRQGNVGTTLSQEVTTRLRENALANGLTLNTLVQGAWALLLARYSGERDVVFGVVRACRRGTVDGADEMIGLFINTVPLRTTVADDRPLLDWLMEVRTSWRALRDHEHTSLVDLQQWVGLPRSVPLFNSILMFEEYLLDDWMRARGGSWATRSVVAHERPGYPLTAKAYDGPYLSLQLDFDRGRMEEATAWRVLSHFHAALVAMADGLAMRTGDISLCSPAERHQVVTEWNSTEERYPYAATVAAMFEEQAAQRPDIVAILNGEEAVTYRELGERANALAHRLQHHGVGPDVCVGVCLERSTEMMIAVLAVLKAGGAYVPLDPAYPRDRLAYMLESSRAPLVLTQKHLRERLPVTAAQVVTVDELPDGSESREAPRSAAGPENLAYVIYTSGSTGQPKGVAMPHRPLVNLLHWQLANSGMGEGARTLQFSSLSFDVSFQELFSTWLSGGTLVLISEAMRRDPASLLVLIDRTSIKRIFLPFIALQQLAEVADETDSAPASLREVITAGEQLQVTGHLIRFFTRIRNAFLENQYGPTETHVVTAFRLSGSPSGWPALPPIGRPISNARVYLLDANCQPVPVGVPGELHIAGASLAHGYLHRPELTAEKFLPDPFMGAGARMYRTGDIARFQPDGNIEYLGRADNQLKIRGYRVELGEIEAVLSGQPSVRECAVTARDVGGSRQLVAYFVDRDGPATSPDTLRGFLAKLLPEHMVPSAYVRLPALPLTPSGKVDRRSLPSPSDGDLGSSRRFVEPTNLIEMQLVALWQRLLGRRDIGTDDDFFELGGHSLLAVRMFGQIRKTFGRNLPLVALFEAPTIGQLARRLKQDRFKERWASVVPLQSAGTGVSLFLIPGGGGNLLGYRHLIPHLSPEHPSYGFQPPSLEGTRQHFGSIEETAAHYVSEMKLVQPKGPYCIQGWCIGGLVALEMAQQLRAEGEHVALLVMVDTTFPRSTPPGLGERIGHMRGELTAMPVLDAARYAARRLWGYPLDRYRRLVSLARSARFTLRIRRAEIAPRTLTEDHVLAADWRMAARYKPRPYEGEIVFVWPGIKPPEAYVDSRREWTRIALGGARHITVRGNHHSMFEEPLVGEFAGLLAELLGAASGKTEIDVRPAGSSVPAYAGLGDR